MIKEFNQFFTKILTNHSLKDRFILGLSGGPDSIALLHLLKNFNSSNLHFNVKIFPVIVDHSIRINSSIESKKIKEYSQKLGFKAKIKKIREKVPRTNIQNWARVHRRNLLIEEAIKTNSHLILGHHLDDQAETIFMRLNKGSGLKGLIGMKIVNDWQGIKIIRPLMIFKKKLIIQYIFEKNLFHVIDPSNDNIKFERVSTRKLLKKIDSQSENSFTASLIRLSDLNNKFFSIINLKLKNWIEKNIFYYKHGSVVINFEEYTKLSKYGNELPCEIFAKVLQNVGGKTFAPKKEKLKKKINLLINHIVKKITIANVLIYQKSNKIIFLRENRNLFFKQKIKKKYFYIYDGRFALKSRFDGNLLSSYDYGLKILDFEKSSLFSNKSDYINKTIPVLKTLEGRVISPYLSIIDKKDMSNIELGLRDFNFFYIKDIEF